MAELNLDALCDLLDDDDDDQMVEEKSQVLEINFSNILLTFVFTSEHCDEGLLDTNYVLIEFYI